MVWEDCTMKVVADEKKRVVLPSARPGDSFEIQTAGEGKFILIRLVPATTRPARVKVEKRGRFTVGVLDRPIDEQAIKDALAEFP
jgi:hypothetical protein